ncbi:flavin reductase family protein [Streptomyces avidinii]|uniref:flavin reductase family protein n=1 Tax=Streptomyces avidinii TaxID=1895 RepID=UPI00386F81DF|nr:flavin reductase family protein [Streptomyces avidinii]
MSRAPVARPQLDADAFRTALGHFATGVAVITTTGPAGFTCQSLTSLSLDPPMVSFSVSRTSATWPRIEVEGAVCVNILGQGQAALARRFAAAGTDRFADTPWMPSEVLGLPRLDGVTACIEATVEAVYPGGDHHLVVCRVAAVDTVATAEPPLIYYRGRLTKSDQKGAGHA